MSENTMLADRSKKSSRVLFIIVGIGVVGLFLFFVVHSIQKRRSVAEAARLASAPHTIEVRVVSPSLAPDTTIILLPGTVQGHRETSLYARVNGYIRNWYVDIGDPVKEGQLLAELETPELDQQLAQARANLELAKSSLERVNSVTVEGAVSTQQKADRDGAYRAALALVNQLEAQKSFQRVVAPFSGIITSRSIDIGTLVNAGSVSSQQLFTIAQVNQLRIFVNVPQSFVSSIKIGSKASIIIQEIAAVPVIGKVTRTAGALNPDTRTLLVQVEFDNPGHLYLPGMYAKVKFVVRRTTRAIIIPANTLVIRTEGPEVVTVTPQNTIAMKRITIRKDNGATLEISDGLKGDELLVTNASLDLTEGLKVSVVHKLSEN
ncbi:MAG TPA: efflux RND transporter periplasmic adaptor subunit [Cyclobacteriaceae bacterium]|nr:efflux RND transporter periplasmic adaptor subunit [Cyclobacteriaceae bacterium]